MKTDPESKANNIAPVSKSTDAAPAASANAAGYLSASNTTSSGTRGRQRIYASGTEKLEAFRTRHADAGYLRKEVLVHQSTADKLAEIAKLEGASITNTASGLLELGIAQYESLKSAGLVIGSEHLANTSAPVVSESLASALRAYEDPRPRGFLAGSPVPSGSTLSAASTGSASSIVGSLSAVNQASSAPLGAYVSSNPDGSNAPVVNPISNFFQKRKQNVK